MLKSGTQNLQSIDRNQWDIEAIAKSLGDTGTNAQASITTWALGESYSIKFPSMCVGLQQEFFNKDRQLASMVGANKIFLHSRSTAINADSSRASVGGCFNAQYGHSD
jgi:hypothetical protein